MKIDLKAIDYETRFTRDHDQRIRIQRKIARGGEAEIYDAFDLEEAREVVAKIFHSCVVDLSLVKFHEKISMYSHPNLVKVHKVTTHDNTFYVTMEKCEMDLFTCIERQKNGKLDEISAQKFFFDITNGLLACHNIGIVHGDIKPENILLLNGVAKLADFNSKIYKYINNFNSNTSKSINVDHSSQSHHQLSFVTVEYAAPERIKGQDYHHHQQQYHHKHSHNHNHKDHLYVEDVWSLGITLFVMVSGQLPWQRACSSADTDNRYTNYCQDKESLWPDSFSADLRDLLGRMLEPNPGHRISLSEVWTHPWLSSLVLGSEYQSISVLCPDNNNTYSDTDSDSDSYNTPNNSNNKNNANSNNTTNSTSVSHPNNKSMSRRRLFPFHNHNHHHYNINNNISTESTPPSHSYSHSHYSENTPLLSLSLSLSLSQQTTPSQSPPAPSRKRAKLSGLC
eukprot:gene8101-16633_t